MVRVIDITHAIQLAVAPVFLLTAIATMLNVMSGRLARVVDRRRAVETRLAGGAEDGGDRAELVLLDQRAGIIYRAILSTVLSALLVCLVVAGAFIGVLLGLDTAKAVAALFILSMGALIAGLSLLLREIYLAVRTGTHGRR